MHLPLPSHRQMIEILLRDALPARSGPARNLLTFVAGWLVVFVFVLATHAQGAARIDSVNRSTHVDGQGMDFSPYAEEDLADNNGSPAAGTFSGGVTLPIALNDNYSLFQAVQNSTVSLAALNFSGTGSITTSQQTNFDANDAANHAFLQGATGSTFSVFFTLANSGKVNLNVTIAAATAHSATSFGGASAVVQLMKGSTIVWSRYTSNGTVSFNGDITLAAGWYQLSVGAHSNVDTRSPQGAQLVTSNASFNVSGQITENASGGGKKK
jgi:hypothetical protein